MCPCVPDQIGIWKCCFFLGEGESRVPGEKPLRARERTNKQTQPT